MDLKSMLVELINQVQDEGCNYSNCHSQWDRPEHIDNSVIADALIAHGVTVQEWISVKDRLPTEEEWLFAEGCSFLCKVLIPIPGGAADNKQRVIGYDRLHRRWACEDIIVTHWMPLPKGE